MQSIRRKLLMTTTFVVLAMAGQTGQAAEPAPVEWLLCQSRRRWAPIRHGCIDQCGRPRIAGIKSACFQQCHAGVWHWILHHTRCFTAGAAWCATDHDAYWAGHPQRDHAGQGHLWSKHADRQLPLPAIWRAPAVSRRWPRLHDRLRHRGQRHHQLEGQEFDWRSHPRRLRCHVLGPLGRFMRSARSSSPPKPAETRPTLGGAPVSAHVSFDPLILFSGITYRF